MAYGLTVRRGGAFNRLAEPLWDDPLDTDYARDAGGRWNAPGDYGVLYLNAGEHTARLQVRHRLAGQPYDIEDLDPAAQHDLVEVRVRETAVLDAVSAAGLEAVALPGGYPLDAQGRRVGHAACRPVGRAAYEDGHPGIACRSAAGGARHEDEELAVFDRDAPGLVELTGRRAFGDWYLGEP